MGREPLDDRELCGPGIHFSPHSDELLVCMPANDVRWVELFYIDGLSENPSLHYHQ
jgi:hypothetical protein